MKDEGLAVAFWNRVDKFWQDRSLKEFSAATGVDYVLLLNWRTKKRLPSLEHACAISKVLGTTIEYLVTGEDPDAPPTFSETPRPPCGRWCRCSAGSSFHPGLSL
jgi:transcriptional regulator with XRE-family HTH domain